MIVKFHPDAQEEFDLALDFYELEAWEGTRERFQLAVETAARIIEKNPRRWPQVGEGVRRNVLTAFPYLIHYVEEEQYILIVSVTHTSREPDYWRYRLG